MDETNTEQRTRWNGDAGEIWVDIQVEMDRQLAPLGRAAMDVLAPRLWPAPIGWSGLNLNA